MDNKGTGMPSPELFKNQALTSEAEAKSQTAHPSVNDGAPAVRMPVEAPAPKKIDVVALRAGYYNQSRKAEGDKFAIASMDELGSWMRLADPKAEKARRDADLKEKMAAKEQVKSEKKAGK